MKNQNIIRIMTFVISLILVISLFGCTSNKKDPALVGLWIEDSNVEYEGLPAGRIEYFADGKILVLGTTQGTYRILKGNIQEATVEGKVMTATYKIVGNKMTLTQDDGDFKVYTKQK